MPDDPEPRFTVNLLVRVFGMDADRLPFSQNSHARNISDHGAKISGLEKQLTPGDVIGVQLGDSKCRCRVIWTMNAGPGQNIEVGVQLVEGQPSPWDRERKIQRAIAARPISRTRPGGKEKRKFSRQHSPFSIEIRDTERASTPVKMATADIAGNGCYVLALLPLPVKRKLTITFWLNSEPVNTAAVVRTSHGGVGMGIEFTGLDEATQKQLQLEVESLFRAFASSGPKIVRNDGTDPQPVTKTE